MFEPRYRFHSPLDADLSDLSERLGDKETSGRRDTIATPSTARSRAW
jgi:hypothetical protein